MVSTRKKENSYLPERFVRSTMPSHWGRRGGSTRSVDTELLAGGLEPCHELAVTVHPYGYISRKRQRADETHHEAPAL